MNWVLEKYLGDGSIYARCDNCGWEYNCSCFDIEDGQIVVSKIHKYCAECGAKAENFPQENYDVIWNKRYKE